MISGRDVLERPVWLAGVELKAGVYQLALLLRGADRAEAYFFAGVTVEPEKLKAATSVEIEGRSQGDARVDVRYKPLGRGHAISEIHLPDKILRLP